MYNANEYTNENAERDERDASEIAETAADVRMVACDKGLVSYRPGARRRRALRCRKDGVDRARLQRRARISVEDRGRPAPSDVSAGRRAA
jgi:hypothetical protein